MKEIICYSLNGETLNHFTQWDYNQKLVVKDIEDASELEFHFCNKYSASATIELPSLDNMGAAVSVPDILLQKATPLIVHVYRKTQDESASTICTIRIPVYPRARPDNYPFSDKYATIRRIESAFTIDRYGMTAVDVGFKPDAVVIRGEKYNTTDGQIECNLQAIFTEGTTSAAKRLASYSPSGEINGYPIINAIIEQTDTGFMVNRLWHCSHSGMEYVYGGSSYSYIALKYT